MLEAKIDHLIGVFHLNAEIVAEGLTSLWGNNGVGKTTLLRVLAGIYPVQRGFIRVDGEDVTHLPMEKRRIVLVDNYSYFPNMTVKQHLDWGRKMGQRWEQESHLMDDDASFGLGKHLYNIKVGTLSLGNRVRVSLATAFASSPRAVLIDDVLSNLDDKEQIMKSIKGLCKKLHVDVIYTHQLENDLPRVYDVDYTIKGGVCSRLS